MSSVSPSELLKLRVALETPELVIGVKSKGNLEDSLTYRYIPTPPYPSKPTYSESHCSDSALSQASLMADVTEISQRLW